MDSAVEFTPWGKISRLYRDVVITEKIDGTNAAVCIKRLPWGTSAGQLPPKGVTVARATSEVGEDGLPVDEFWVYAQSRTRLISVEDDNFGFANWVMSHSQELADRLGEGIHFGEWWGSGIQRGYGLTKGEKRFSLFNTERWSHIPEYPNEPGKIYTQQVGSPQKSLVYRVPTLYRGVFDEDAIHEVLERLRGKGSPAAWGWGAGETGKKGPEGIVIYHTHSRTMFKVTLEGDEMTKGEAERRARG